MVLASEKPAADALAFSELATATLRALVNDPAVPDALKQAAQSLIDERGENETDDATDDEGIAASFSGVGNALVRSAERRRAQFDRDYPMHAG